MRLSRKLRFLTALIALFGVLFTQLAIAGYYCPNMQIAQAMEQAAMMVQHQDMEGCSGMDADQPAKCHAQGEVGTQSLDKAELPQVSPFLAAILVNAISFDHTFQSATPQNTGPLLARTTAPPVAIQNCCFRI